MNRKGHNRVRWVHWPNSVTPLCGDCGEEVVPVRWWGWRHA